MNNGKPAESKSSVTFISISMIERHKEKKRRREINKFALTVLKLLILSFVVNAMVFEVKLLEMSASRRGVTRYKKETFS